MATYTKLFSATRMSVTTGLNGRADEGDAAARAFAAKSSALRHSRQTVAGREPKEKPLYCLPQRGHVGMGTPFAGVAGTMGEAKDTREVQNRQVIASVP